MVELCRKSCSVLLWRPSFSESGSWFSKNWKNTRNQKTDVGVRFCRQNSQPNQHCLPKNVQRELKNVKKPSRWRRSDPRCSTTGFAGANVMMFEAIRFTPFPKYDSDCEEEERVQKGISVHYRNYICSTYLVF